MGTCAWGFRDVGTVSHGKYVIQSWPDPFRFKLF